MYVMYVYAIYGMVCPLWHVSHVFRRSRSPHATWLFLCPAYVKSSSVGHLDQLMSSERGRGGGDWGRVFGLWSTDGKPSETAISSKNLTYRRAESSLTDLIKWNKSKTK